MRHRQHELALFPYTRWMDEEALAGALNWGSYFFFPSTHDHINPGEGGYRSLKWVFLRARNKRSSLTEWLDHCLTVKF